MSNLVISSPYVGIAILVIFCFAGKFFRDNWKSKGENWKRNCWITGMIATACFLILAFIPYVPNA